MGLTTHGDHLLRLRRFGVVEVYFVREDDGLTVVDTATRSADAILAAARTLGQTIRRVVLTHAHVDHAGSLDALVAELGADVEVAVGAREAALLAGDMSLRPGEPDRAPTGGFPTVTTVPTRLLEPGDRVGSLEVVATPGHTPGHISLLDTRDRTLLAGDCWQTLGGVAVCGDTRWRFPLPAMATWDKPTNLASAERTLELDPMRLAPGHGPVVDLPQGTMRLAVERARRAFA